MQSAGWGNNHPIQTIASAEETMLNIVKLRKIRNKPSRGTILTERLNLISVQILPQFPEPQKTCLIYVLWFYLNILVQIEFLFPEKKNNNEKKQTVVRQTCP